MKKKQNNKLVIVLVIQIIIALILICLILITRNKRECKVVVAEQPILNTESVMQLKPMPVVDTPIFADWYEETIKPSAPHYREHNANEVITFCGVLEEEYGIIISDDDKIGLIDGSMSYEELLKKVVK